MGEETKIQESRLDPYMSRLGVWAFSIGTSIGWGSFIVTCNTYLSQAGIMGTALGLLLGMAVILVISFNLCYMMERAPSAGGIYSYGRKIRGYDTGFLVGWFLLLTYFAVLWANITSLPLFARRFAGNLFEFGYCYTVFGYDVYIGEVLLSVAAISAVGFICARSRMIPQYLMIVMAVVFVGSVIACTVFCLLGHTESSYSFDPLYVPDKSEINQIVRIAVISPWAFIGFENVAHFSEEFAFPVRKIRNVMIASVLFTTAFYILMTILSVTAYPQQYGSWYEYVGDMNNLSGIISIPAFYAAFHYMGNTGVTVLMLALLSVVITSMFGNLTAISRLIYAFGRDHEWAAKASEVNRYHVPERAIIGAVIISCLIPFLGRTAIGWIVDVTTLGATIIYGFLSFFVLSDAKERGDRTEVVTGTTGMVLMIFFALFLLVPKVMSYEAMEPESYFLFAGWSLLGIAVFRIVLLHDDQNNYGHSVIVWIVLLLLMLMTVMLWESSETEQVTEEAMERVRQYYLEDIYARGATGAGADVYVAKETARITNANTRCAIIAYSLFMIAVALMMNNYMIAKRREHDLATALGEARKTGLLDPLTGVKNKRSYTEWEQNINAKIQADEIEPFAVVVCDVNDLKGVNDNCGHKEGDECIRRACGRICSIFSHSPVFRYGGDEFAVLLFGQDYEQREQLMRLAKDQPAWHGCNREGTFAAGMAEYRHGQGTELQTIFEAADKAMYEEKRKIKEKNKIR